MKEKMFAGYPDVVNVDQLREMLGGIGYKAAYGLLHGSRQDLCANLFAGSG